MAALGFAAAAFGTFLAWRGLKDNSKGRHAQIAIDLGRRWDESQLASVRRDIYSMSAAQFRSYEGVLSSLYYSPKGRVLGTEYADVDAFASFFEDLGVLNKLGILTTEWVDDTLGSSVRDFWVKWHLVAADERRHNPKVYENWEHLALKIWARREEALVRLEVEARRKQERRDAARLGDPFSVLPW